MAEVALGRRVIGTGHRRLRWTGWALAVAALMIAGFGLAGCGDDDSAAPAATRMPTRTIDPGEEVDPTPTPTIGPCSAAVAAQCAADCASIGGCCAIADPVSGAYACFDPSVQCDFPCPTSPPGWIGNTECGPAPGDDPSAACLVITSPTTTPVPPTETPTPTETSTPTDTATPGGVSPTPTPSTTPNGCSTGNGVSFTNNNPYPIWLAEAYQGSGNLAANIIAPPDNNWEIAATDSVSLCLPSGWSGRFWPRTECQFAELFANDPDYQACTAAGDCTASAQPHICYGGRCMLDCSSGSTPFCQGATGLDDQNAICVISGFAGGAKFCSYPQGVVCKTGDCQGLYQCYGVWDGYTAEYGASGPVSLFEPTSNSPSDVNYDVSLVSGYNTQILVQPSSSSCYAPGCLSDLNLSCPVNLRLTEAPSATTGPIACGTGTFCQSGACVDNSTCVIGCNDPADQCGTASPPSGLNCNVVVPNGDGASTYGQMYLAAGPAGNTMISGNQGTPTCWGALDCLPNETCTTGVIANFPAGVGVCVPDGGSPIPQIACAAQTDVGNACGGYSTSFTDAIGYTCVSIGAGSADVACVPAYDPPVSGVGTLTSGGGSTFYSGTACPVNPTWVAAATQAGNGTPWYEVFSAACPHQYGWTYDDHTGGFDCNPGDGSAVSFTITFGPPQP